jgi:hypothetical protein
MISKKQLLELVAKAEGDLDFLLFLIDKFFEKSP